jgi:TolB protein
VIFNLINSKKKTLKIGPGSYYEPKWSPSNDEILFTKVLGDTFFIGTTNLIDESETLLSSHYLAEAPNWSPDGNYIIHSFKNNAKSSYKLQVISKTGRKIKILESLTNPTEPLWVPAVM